MIKVDLFFGLIWFVLFVYCLVEAISTPDAQVRNLPKIAWVLLILFFPLVGSIAWLVVGRPDQRGLSSRERSMPAYPEYDRPGRAAGASPESDEEFLQRTRDRAADQRKRYDEQKRRDAEDV